MGFSDSVDTLPDVRLENTHRTPLFMPRYGTIPYRITITAVPSKPCIILLDNVKFDYCKNCFYVIIFI